MPLELRMAPGFHHEFKALPQHVQAEFKDNYRTAEAGRLVNGQFTQRLCGRQLTYLSNYECLVGMKKMYLSDAQYRVVFLQSGNVVLLIAAGKRRDMLVYNRARDRVNNLKRHP